MKVLHLETGRHLYGGGLQVLYLHRGLLERGVESRLLLPEGSAVAREATTWDLPTLTFRYGGEADLLTGVRLGRVLRAERPDLVHLHSRRGADTWGALAALGARIPVVLTRRVDNPEPRWLFGLKYRAYRHVIAISETIEAVLVDQGLDPAKLTRVHSAVDVDEWTGPRERSVLEAEFDLPPGIPAAAMVAQLIERKGHRVLLEAVARLRAQGLRVAVVLFGEGPLREELERTAVRLAVDDLIRFAGFRMDLPDWLGAFDLCVHPAHLEGLGVAVLQAGAAGLTVVGGGAGGVREVVVHGETGLLVPPRDDAALASAIREVVSDPHRAAAMGARARLRIRERFSVEAMVEGNLAVYRKVLAA